MQLQRIAFCNGFDTVGIGEGQDAVLIGVGAQILDIVGGEEEAVGSVRIEGDFSGFVIAFHGDRSSGFRGECEGLRRNGVIAGQLVADGCHIVQLQRIAFCNSFNAVGIGEGQNAVFKGVGAQIFNIVGGEEETVGSVRIEGDLGGFIITLNGDRFGCRSISLSFFFSWCFFSRRFCCGYFLSRHFFGRNFNCRHFFSGSFLCGHFFDRNFNCRHFFSGSFLCGHFFDRHFFSGNFICGYFFDRHFLSRHFFSGGFLCRSSKHRGRNGIIAGQLFTVRVGVVELDGIAFTGRGLAVFIGEGQNTILIGVSSEVLNGIGREEETVGAVGFEGHFCAFIITLHRDRLGCRDFLSCRCSFFGRSCCKNRSFHCKNGFFSGSSR